MSDARNHLAFLLVLDEYTRAHPAGCITTSWELHTIAHEAGLVAWEERRTGHWAGELVDLGYLKHGPGSAGDNRPVPPGFMWSDEDASRFSDYRITSAGREEADRMRRLRRERRTDVALGYELPKSSPAHG
jgi:hypothetical protein